MKLNKFAAHPIYTNDGGSQATDAAKIMALEAQLDEAKAKVAGLEASVEALQQALVERIEYINKVIMGGDF